MHTSLQFESWNLQEFLPCPLPTNTKICWFIMICQFLDKVYLFVFVMCSAHVSLKGLIEANLKDVLHHIDAKMGLWQASMIDFTLELCHVIFHEVCGCSLTIGAPHCSSIVLLHIEEFLVQLKEQDNSNQVTSLVKT